GSVAAHHYWSPPRGVLQLNPKTRTHSFSTTVTDVTIPYTRGQIQYALEHQLTEALGITADLLPGAFIHTPAQISPPNSPQYSIQGASFAETDYITPLHSPTDSRLPTRSPTPDFDLSLLDLEIPRLPSPSPITSPIIPAKRMAEVNANANANANATTATRLPPRGKAAAPVFYPNQPRELLRFFGEIDILCRDYGVTDEQERKDATLRYVDYDTAEIWRMLPTYKPAPEPEQGQAARDHSLKAWRDEVAKLYPGASEDTRYSYDDLNRLVNTVLARGIDTQGVFAAYHRQFLLIASWLVTHGKISNNE
ncbi:hypothetical protein H0H93_014729, partial [Arthromyces matolae]